MKRLLVSLLLFWIAVPLAWCEENDFSISLIPDSIFALMQGKSFASDCTTKRSDLRYVRVLHYDEKGKVQQGELVCHKTIAQDLLEIFQELYRQHYVIARIKLIDEYDADDQRSMTANNTSCFNYRKVSGTQMVSKHGKGMAIDINPLYNPFVRVRKGKTLVEPKAGMPFASERAAKKQKKQIKGASQIIDRNDLCYKLFRQHGFRWGGAWQSSKDYQHFEK